MHRTKPHLTRHRRARLIAWALAMLMWMQSVLFAGAVLRSRHLRQRAEGVSLHGLTRMVKRLIIVRAWDFARLRQRNPRRFSYRGRDLRPDHVIRALIGGRVRRALQRRDIGARIAVLIGALRHLDRWAACVAKRMQRQLTRLWPIAPAPGPGAPIAAFAAAPARLADTS